ncbi:MAG: hypothetical protein HFJ54_04170 [Clostridia bacterium]|nr:hypothetical protein [Clostridia bacterium]
MVDGDDWVNTENMPLYIKFLEKNDVDMLVTNYCLVDNDTEEEVPQHLDNVEYGKILDFKDVCKNLKLEMHNITYKTAILQDNDIKLDNCFYTDTEYLLFPIPFISSVAFLDTIIYMYRVSLSTQSMSIESLQKNIKMHELVLNHHIENYQRNKNKMEDEKANYMANRISEMLGTHLSILLSYKPEKKHRQAIQDMIKNTKEKSLDIYNKFKNKRTVKLLESTNYVTYRLVSILHRKKVGAK